MNLIGKKVKNNLSVVGEITAVEGKYITVAFPGKVAKFPYDSFGIFINAIDADVQEYILSQAKKMKEAEEDPPIDPPTGPRWYGDVFVFKNKKTTYDNKPGYAVYDCYGQNMVGVVWSHYQKKGQLSEGQAEIRFLDKYKNEYHKWRLVFQNGWRMPFDKLESMIKDKEEVKLTIDPWQGKK